MESIFPATLSRVERIVQTIRLAIETGRLPPGARLPSIRQQARDAGVSPFTVVEAYDRLVSLGLLLARPGAGFFVLPSGERTTPSHDILDNLPIDEHWLLRNVYIQHGHGTQIPAGCGWLPGDWYDREAQQRALRTIAREAQISTEYGAPQGFLPLRQLLARQLNEHDILIDAEEIILTQGASSALDIAAATCARPGDTLFVDDPGYCNLLSSLTFHGYQIVGVPWTEHGPDIAIFEQLLLRHRPRAYFTNPWLQNPTGASYSTPTAHQVLRLAEQHDFLVVEDNVSGDLAGWRQPTLAALDGMKHVIYIGSFSKSLSPALRVGFVSARRGWIEKMVRYKMMSGLTTPELNERITHEILQESRQRKQLEKLRNRLSQAQFTAAQRFEAIGWQVFTRPQNGLFILARPNADCDSFQLAQQALQKNILLAPGQLFRPNGANSSWLRFNVAYLQNEALWPQLASSHY